MKSIRHNYDVCVIGGGIAGLCAAIAAARGGAKTAIVHDRPVFGGNSSSEIRVHVCGADRHNTVPNMRETGILEEFRMENLRRNPQRSFSIWDTILYEAVLLEPNLHHYLNCSVFDAQTERFRINSVTGWQLTTYTKHVFEAAIFVDCSGDAVLAPLTGAHYRVGREARSEYNESAAPEIADRKTMGMTCLFQAKNMGFPQPFERPSWAYEYPADDDLPERWHGWFEMGYWWIELGGEDDSVHDTERVRDELIKIVYGIWDHIKNHGDHGAANWALDWVQFLPGKRESRRYVGAHVLTQNDILSGGRFEDVVAYGGWKMDDHNPAGFRHKGPPTNFYDCPSPYGIPYRCLFSRNVENLMFAGRCASASHMAMSSARVMGTGASMGQAAGTAAAMAVKSNALPRDISGRVRELQQSLLRQDAYLPGVRQQFSPITLAAKIAASKGNPEPLRDGINRPVGDDTHSWSGEVGDFVSFEWERPEHVESVSLVFDSALHRLVAMSYHQWDDQLRRVPEEMVKDFRIEVKSGGDWQLWKRVTGNYKRLARVEINAEVTGVRAVFDSTWGSPVVRLFAFYLE